MSFKAPLFICAVTGAKGGFIEKILHDNSKRQFKVKFIPLNSLVPKIHSEIYNEDDLITIYPDDATLPGVRLAYLIGRKNINQEKNFMDKIYGKQQDLLEANIELERELQSKKIRIQNLELQLSQFEKEKKQQMARNDEGNRSNQQPNSLFGMSRPPMRDPFNNFGGNNNG